MKDSSNYLLSNQAMVLSKNGVQMGDVRGRVYHRVAVKQHAMRIMELRFLEEAHFGFYFCFMLFFFCNILLLFTKVFKYLPSVFIIHGVVFHIDRFEYCCVLFTIFTSFIVS